MHDLAACIHREICNHNGAILSSNAAHQVGTEGHKSSDLALLVQLDRRLSDIFDWGYSWELKDHLYETIEKELLELQR